MTSTGAGTAGGSFVALAKIAPPQGSRLLARQRLFDRLDALRQVPVVWLAAAPGAGKTTLVSSWLAERPAQPAPAHLWYQLDAEDGDVATFFHYLGIAVRRVARHDDLPLPVLTPEYLPGLLGFTRRYAETLTAAIGPHAVLVLDNYELLPAASPLHEVVRELASSLPRGANLVVLSRSEPPPAFARLRLHEGMVVLDGRELDLTRDEALALAAAREAPSPPAAADPLRIERLLLETRGWLAGFTLLLSEPGDAGAAARPAAGQTRQLLFDYFATELFERFAAPVQHALLCTALLPAMTVADAEQLSLDAGVGGVLADLHRRNCFVVRRGTADAAAAVVGSAGLAGFAGDAVPPAYAPTTADAVDAADAADAVYEYHALFRAFLLNRAATHVEPAAWRVLQCRAAALLADDGQADAAAGLFRAAHDADGLAALVLREAPALVSAGRHRTLGRWLDDLPPAAFERSPWLHHWRAAARLPFDPVVARSDFERAYAGFQRSDDAVGLYSTWAGAMESFFFEWRDFSPADPWIAEFERLRERHPDYPSRAVELRTYWSMGTLLHRQPQHRLLPAWSQRALALLEPHGLMPAERDLAVLLGGYLVIWFLWRGETSQARGVVERIAPWSGPGQQRAPMVTILWSCAVALYHSVQGETDACRAAVQAGLALAGRSGLQAFDFLLAAQMARCCLVAGDVPEAESWIAAMARTMRGHSHLNGAFYWHLHCNAAAQRGDWQQAVEHARGGMAMAIESGVPYVEAHCHIDLARAYSGRGGVEGDHGRCAAHLDAAQAIGLAMGSRVIDYLCREARAAAAFRAGNEAAGLEHLREALATSRAMGGATWLMAGPAASAPLFDRALAAGIEVDHVRQLIRRHRIAPPEPALAADSWPWPIRLYTLGRFDILRDDEPLLRPSGKVQHKPLELLKCLCAFGGQAVAQDRVTDALWPEAEGDAADPALRTTLHRLRKLLHNDRAVRLEDRQLHLDPQLVWADCLAFDRVAHHPQLADRDALRRALDRYRGDFLPGESAPWAIAFRERLRAQHLRMAERLGGLIEDDGDLSGAIGCWLRAIEVEPLAENLHRRLMHAYVQLGRRPEALAVYQRCRLSLLSRLGISPAADTQALHQSLVDAG